MDLTGLQFEEALEQLCDREAPGLRVAPFVDLGEELGQGPLGLSLGPPHCLLGVVPTAGLLVSSEVDADALRLSAPPLDVSPHLDLPVLVLETPLSRGRLPGRLPRGCNGGSARLSY